MSANTSCQFNLAEHANHTNTAFSDFLQTLQQIRVAVENEWLLFKEKYKPEQYQNAEPSPATTEQHDDQKITLNVGGQTFTTYHRTILAEKDTFFWSLLHSGQWQPDHSYNTEYFIDRSPTTFSFILDYLRYGTEISVFDLAERDRQMLFRDIEYYQIGSLQGLKTVTTIRWFAWDMESEDQEDFLVTQEKDHSTVIFKPTRCECHQHHTAGPRTASGCCCVEMGNAGGTSTVNGRYIFATFPEATQVRNPRWRVTVTKNAAGEWPSGSLGLGEAPTTGWLAADQKGVYVDVGPRGHRIWVGRDYNDHCVVWPADSRVADFYFERDTALVTITINGKKHAHRVSQKVQKNPTPWCMFWSSVGGASCTISSVNR